MTDVSPGASALPREFGEYTLTGELGHGAMGVVFAATHRILGRRVALKVLRNELDETGRERFRREARATAQVRHPNIVEIHAAGEIDGHPYYAMALIPGRSLADVAGERKLPPSRELARSLAEIADALDALHRAGVVHRDVKPSNIIVEPGGRMVLADFGLARISNAKLTATGHVLGTPAYMSPEQLGAGDAEIDGRADVYSLGATLYELVVGRPMFRRDEPMGMLRAIHKDEPARPRDLVPDVDVALERIVLKAIEKRREDRYASAAAMRDDLRAYAAGGRVVGRPMSRSARGVRAAARRWPWAAVVVVAALLGCAWSRRPTPSAVGGAPPGPALVNAEGGGTKPPDDPVVAANHDDGAVHIVGHAPGTCPVCDLYRKAQGYVVRIVTKEGLGAGVVVARDGLIVTNAHVVGSETVVSVETENGARYVGDVAARDSGEDLALVRIQSSGIRWSPASIVAGDPPPVGSEVFVIGHPMGLGWTVTRGIVSASRVAPGVPSMIQTDAPISPGNSGGPLLDDEGHLLGIVTSKALGGGAENLGFARPASAVVEFLRRAGIATEASPR